MKSAGTVERYHGLAICLACYYRDDDLGYQGHLLHFKVIKPCLLCNKSAMCYWRLMSSQWLYIARTSYSSLGVLVSTNHDGSNQSRDDSDGQLLLIQIIQFQMSVDYPTAIYARLSKLGTVKHCNSFITVIILFIKQDPHFLSEVTSVGLCLSISNP